MFTIVQAGSSYKILDTDGSLHTTLVLPTGVTVDASARSQFHTLSNRLIITGAPSVNLWVDPTDFTVRPLAVLPPSTPPTLAAGGGVGLTGVLYAAYSYITEIDGIVVQESPLSPLSLPVTLINQDIDWTSLAPSTESHVTGYRLYRTVEDGSPTVLFEVAIIGNQVDTSYLGDNLATAALGLLPQPLVGNAPGGTTPGTRLQACTQWNDRLWGVADDPDLKHLIYFTESGNPFAWLPTNFIPMPVKGEDETGVVGFLPRRDELVCGKRRRIGKIIGDVAGNFEYINIAEGVGCVARDSCVVIDDTGYMLGDEGVWRIDANGVSSATEGKIGAWYQTDVQFEPALRYRAMGGYNPLTHCYELFAATTGIINTALMDAWACLNKRTAEWVGPHVCGALSIYSRGTRFDAAGRLAPVLGGSDGYLYDMNQAEAYDTQGGGQVHGIPIHWRSKRYGGDGMFYRFGQLALTQRAQGDAADEVIIEVFVGPLDERNLLSGPGGILPTWTRNAPLSIAHWEGPRVGMGESCSITLYHNLGGVPAPIYGDSRYDVELYGLDFDFFAIGRRERSGYGR